MARKIFQYTSTGATDAINLDRGHKTTFRYYVSQGSTSTPPTVTVEGKVHKESDTWGAIRETNINLNTAYVSDGPLEQIRLNISSLGTATEISFEVVGSRQI